VESACHDVAETTQKCANEILLLLMGSFFQRHERKENATNATYMPPRWANLKNGKEQLSANEFYLPHFQINSFSN
jgi:hypothetical protein